MKEKILEKDLKENIISTSYRGKKSKKKNYIAPSARFRVLSARANNVMNIIHYRKNSDVSNAIPKEIVTSGIIFNVFLVQ